MGIRPDAARRRLASGPFRFDHHRHQPGYRETLSEIELAGAEDVELAYQGARAAQRDWAAAPASVRAEVFLRAARIMEQRRDEIVGWLIAEAGAVRARAEWEWTAVRAVMLEAASYPSRVAGRILPPVLIAGKENRVYRQPVGVAAVISPWNFPLQLSNRAVARALAVGNAVVLKPAGDTPVTGGLLLAHIYQEAGLPAGLLNVVIGASGEVGDPLVPARTGRRRRDGHRRGRVFGSGSRPSCARRARTMRCGSPTTPNTACRVPCSPATSSAECASRCGWTPG
ncbi:aldehyde dehydrogenase family protein [Amycolatopsis anabasis]|uniref:aldehyde dehydrogenase family protein n=1 Tax=Amycolatopsis anabasis TaxID=1840409 RepID=UPI001FE2A247|nr:aldehyde dehydrogenase family protein [Amycolatopsis anabasis]